MSENIMQYKNYAARVEYSPEDKCFVGRVLGTRDVIGLHGESVAELEQDFRETMEYDLKRFLDAQKEDYTTALSEIRSGKKRSHWIWSIFPNIAGLGYSQRSRYYGIKDIAEARAYLHDGILRGRLEEISSELLKLKSDNATEVMGSPDDLKLKSCMTLFLSADPSNEIFASVLRKFFKSEKDMRTTEILQSQI